MDSRQNCTNFMSESVYVSASVSVTVSMSMSMTLSVRKASLYFFLFFFSFIRRYEYLRRLGNCLDNPKGSYEVALKLKKPLT
jgi:hypothetical protein